MQHPGWDGVCVGRSFNQMHAEGLRRKPKRVGLFTHTQVTVTFEWPVTVTRNPITLLKSLWPD